MDIENSSIGLSARIDLALEPDFGIGAMEVRPSLREVRMPEETVILEPRVMQVLVALARNAGEVSSKWELIQSCWDGRAVSDDAISRCISAIRRLEDPGGVKITTIPRVGYRLTETSGPKKSQTSPLPAAGSEPAIGRSRGGVISRLPVSSGRGAWIAGVAAIVLALGAYWLVFARHDARSQLPSVAVLPFNAENNDPEEQAFAKSVSAALANRIGRLPLDVTSPTQSFRFSGADKSAAYEQLPATYIIDGSVRRDGEMLRVSLHFDNRRTRKALFSKSFEAPISDRMQLASRVGAVMANRMATLSYIDPAKPDQAGDMLGFWEAAATNGVGAGHAIMERLARQSPDWGKLQVQYASTSAVMIGAAPLPERQARYEAAMQRIERAARMEPNDAHLFNARAIATSGWDWATREKLLRKGVELAPSDGFLLSSLGNQLLQTGYLGNAAQRLRAAYELDPEPFWLFFDLVAAYQLQNRWDEVSALTENRSGFGADDPPPMLTGMKAGAAAGAGDYDKAMAIMVSGPLGKLRRTDPMQAMRAIYLADKTKRPADIAAAVEVCRAPDMAHIIFGYCLPILSEQGELDIAFAQLARVIPDLSGATEEERRQKWFKAMDMPMSRFSIPQLYRPRLGNLRADPRFTGLVRRLGLIDYWRSKGPPDFCQHENPPVCALVRGAKTGGKS